MVGITPKPFLRWFGRLAAIAALLAADMPLAQAKGPSAAYDAVPTPYGPVADLPHLREHLLRREDELDLVRDAADGRLDRHELHAAAMIAGGVGENDRQCARARIAGLRAELAPQLGRVDPADAPRLLFEFLHRRVLTGGYRDDASNVAVTLAGGPYNCLSAAILFVDLAGKLGIDAQAIQLPGHVFCRARAASDDSQTKWLDIELTAADHFQRPVNRPLDSERRLLSAVELVALVYFNRGVEDLARGRFASAAAANLTALTLDPASPIATDNLLATMNNWALALAREGRVGEALALVKAARQVAPDHPHLQTNQRYLQSRIGTR